MLATRYLCALDPGDERGLTGGIGGTRTGRDGQGAKTGRREGRFLDLAGRRLNNGKA